ncbi:PREDICTED: arylacetamide deacetylase-like 4 [Ficedula albicollis]|uniref:arylacetamide deacetylase-like 4 n=1 Tax=Ficedula albicollis TaxID=59894 RepID=UPI0007AD79FD|nr:PREDICTED: arylacetamide deacetylase-like 4 [Ficedula albicollis]
MPLTSCPSPFSHQQLPLTNCPSSGAPHQSPLTICSSPGAPSPAAPHHVPLTMCPSPVAPHQLPSPGAPHQLPFSWCPSPAAPRGSPSPGAPSGLSTRRLPSAHPRCPPSSQQGRIFEKMELCSSQAVRRFAFSGWRLGPAPGVRQEEAQLGRVPVRLYRPRARSRAALLLFHGGGWICCGLATAGTGPGTDSHERICQYIAKESGSLVVSVGGYKPHKPCEFKPEVFEKVKRICELTLCPLLAEDTIIHQLPESFILTCECDVLRDDGLLYKKRLEDNGVPVTWYHLDDGFHGIVNLFDYRGLPFPSGKRGLDRVVAFIKGL